ncbi:SPOR domain-containing protein [Streptomyces prunicolor]|uniref:SPOR domain-containing protein n=1 Tax=Streptomyces prunicolor TaxID=67348 RepID=UPI0009986F20
MPATPEPSEGHPTAANVGNVHLPWLVIRQDENGNRYRVGRFATRAEAQRVADSLDARWHAQLHAVELTLGRTE